MNHDQKWYMYRAINELEKAQEHRQKALKHEGGFDRLRRYHTDRADCCISNAMLWLTKAAKEDCIVLAGSRTR